MRSISGKKRFEIGRTGLVAAGGSAGEADADGIVTVSELFGYLSRKVPEASGQDQHPVRKGETRGELVIGRIR